MTIGGHFDMRSTFVSVRSVEKTFCQTDLIRNITARRADRRHIENAKRRQSVHKVTDRTMTLYHVTHKNNWFPISTLGILAEFSQSKSGIVFLVSRSKIDWAIEHVSKRNNQPPAEYIVVTVHVRRSRLSRLTWRGSRRGVWRHRGNVPVNRIDWVDSYPEKTLAAFLPEGVEPNQEKHSEGQDRAI
jgi:hypothetical protein